MIRTLFKFALLIVVGLIGYNYFYGTAEEKEQSRTMIAKVKDLGGEAWSLLLSERVKMREGKYDDALNRLESLYDDLRQKAEKLQDSKFTGRLSKLGERRYEIEEGLSKGEELSSEDQLKLEELTADTEALMHEMEAKSQPDAPF